VWPRHIAFERKVFGATQEYKCATFTSAYEVAVANFDESDFGKWSELAPIVFSFLASAIKHSSLYLVRMEIDQIDVTPIIEDLSAREDIVIDDAC
jgi:hypothetical protein